MVARLRPEAEAKGAPCRGGLAAVVDTDPALMDSICAISSPTRSARPIADDPCRLPPDGTAISVQVWDRRRDFAGSAGHVFEEVDQLGNPSVTAQKAWTGARHRPSPDRPARLRIQLRSTPGDGSASRSSFCWRRKPRARRNPRRMTATRLERPADRGRRRRARDPRGDGGLLANWGHRVIAASSGEEAITRLSTCPARPDLLICDYRLPGDENGVGVIERLRSEYNESIPAILITGDTAPSRLAEAEASGVLLLHKPVTNGKLRAAVFNLIALAEAAGATDVGLPSVK